MACGGGHSAWFSVIIELSPSTLIFHSMAIWPLQIHYDTYTSSYYQYLETFSALGNWILISYLANDTTILSAMEQRLSCLSVSTMALIPTSAIVKATLEWFAKTMVCYNSLIIITFCHELLNYHSLLHTPILILNSVYNQVRQ